MKRAVRLIACSAILVWVLEEAFTLGVWPFIYFAQETPSWNMMAKSFPMVVLAGVIACVLPYPVRFSSRIARSKGLARWFSREDPQTVFVFFLLIVAICVCVVSALSDRYMPPVAKPIFEILFYISFVYNMARAFYGFFAETSPPDGVQAE